MVHFAKQNLCFGDYKKENWLLTFRGKKVKLGDFGCSVFMEEEGNCIKGCTPYYALPEVIEAMSTEEAIEVPR